jgi:Xaa-Pro dipeptidase
MTLHFHPEEYERRQLDTRARMQAERLDGLVLFKQESMYYLTGYDTAGYTMFQAMYIGADGSIALLTRSADAYQAAFTSLVEDVRVWVDREGANPALDLRDLLESYGCRGKRLGVEYHAYGLTAQRGKMVEAALEGLCELIDASDLVRLVRLVKSPAELDYLRRAGRLADEALAVANRLARPGTAVGTIYGEMMRTVTAGDGDPPASRWPMGAGDEALLVRYHTGHRDVGNHDQVMFEFGAAYRHYHALTMHTVLTGRASDRHRRMFDACRAALDACEERLRPGNTVGDIFDAHASALEDIGFAGRYLNACGYTVGIAYPPTWMDWPMLWRGNPQPLEPGAVYFMHMILLDRESGCAMALGETAIVTAGPCEPITHAPRELVVNQ